MVKHRRDSGRALQPAGELSGANSSAGFVFGGAFLALAAFCAWHWHRAENSSAKRCSRTPVSSPNPARTPLDFPIARPRLLNRFLVMTKLSAVQAAIRQLDHEEQARLRIWLDEKALDLEEDSPELETELLKAVQGRHSPLSKADLEAVAERALRENRSRRSA
jgi:hypothetical protein